MQVCTSLQTDNHASTPPLSFLQAGCPSCRPTNSVKALKAQTFIYNTQITRQVAAVHLETHCSIGSNRECCPLVNKNVIFFKFEKQFFPNVGIEPGHLGSLGKAFIHRTINAPGKCLMQQHDPPHQNSCSKGTSLGYRLASEMISIGRNCAL